MQYVEQAIPRIDADIAEKGHFWMENNYLLFLMALMLVSSIWDDLGLGAVPSSKCEIVTEPVRIKSR